MSGTFKHIELSDRIKIESMLSICKTPTEIADVLGFSRQAVSLEIKRSRIEQGPAKSYGRHWNGCVHQRRCEIRHACKNMTCNTKCSRCRNYNCVTLCDEYNVDNCPTLERSPFVCNGCPEWKGCAHIRFSYMASVADSRAKGLLVSSRIGPDLTEDEMAHIASVAYPLICNGQSPAQIWMEHSDEMPCSARSFYRYIHDGYFNDICVLNLPAACRYAPRSSYPKDSKPNISAEALNGRLYEDFVLADADIQANAVEMDCVCGKRGSRQVILTLLWRPWLFQLMIIMDSHTAKAVVDALDMLEKSLGEYFPEVILTDRGSEFADAEGIEKTVEGNWKRCDLFYCDPRHSEQKAKCENCHRLIRRILPKGTAFNDLTAEDMALVMSHVNSMPRASLGGKSPMELAMEHLPERLFRDLGLMLIRSDKIILKPHLLR
jgi:IS30 family transposase